MKYQGAKLVADQIRLWLKCKGVTGQQVSIRTLGSGNVHLTVKDLSVDMDKVREIVTEIMDIASDSFGLSDFIAKSSVSIDLDKDAVAEYAKTFTASLSSLREGKINSLRFGGCHITYLKDSESDPDGWQVYYTFNRAVKMYNELHTASEVAFDIVYNVVNAGAAPC